jgi:hypothetical protein
MSRKAWNFIACAALATTALGVPASVTAGTVSVNWIEAEHFSDAGFGAFDRERNLKTLADYLQALGMRLPDGQSLRLDVLDVDLAGREDWHRGQEVRVLRGRADWPRISLRWSLQEDTQPTRSGQIDLADMNYLYDGPFERSGEALYYEKRMLLRWFDQTIAAHPAITSPR